MPCYDPLPGFYSRFRNENGRFSVLFGESAACDLSRPVLVPCGQCLGCKLARAQGRAIQCLHEASLSEVSLFVTLTYDDRHLPPAGSLCKRDCQLFFKRLRKRHSRLRYMLCGEYGPQTHRPHYHALLFGVDFSDKRFFKRRGEFDVFVSRELDGLWRLGLCEFGSVSGSSVSYVARYSVKKLGVSERFFDVDDETGEVREQLAEFSVSSNRPGLGFGWYQKFKKEVFPSCSVLFGGRLVRPPQYYFRLLEREDPALFERVCEEQRVAALKARDQLIAEDWRVSQRLDDRRIVRRASLDFFSGAEL